MNLYLLKFVAHRHGVKLKDVVYNFQTASDSNTGIRSVYFKTRDKYVSVDTNGSIFLPDKVCGKVITILPYIIINDTWVGYDDPDPELQDQFFKHPDFFRVELVVSDPEYSGDSFATMVTPCKNAYIVTYIPWNHIEPSERDFQETKLIHIDNSG